MSRSFADIDADARKTLNDAGVVGIVPVPLEIVAGKLGFEAVAFDGRPDVSGAIDHKNRRIFVNKNESLVRQRFTLAHEIGHAVLHKAEDRVDYRRTMATSEDPKEREANRFASELLMPTDLFRKAFKERNGDIFRLASYFAVSTDAAGYKAKNLGLLA